MATVATVATVNLRQNGAFVFPRRKQTSTFVHQQGRAAYLAHYTGMLRDWPTHETVTVPGRYGHTSTLVTGTPGAPDLVLLHGRYTPAPSWTPLIAGLADNYRVHAIDSIAEPGLSRNDGAPLRTRTDYVTWLTETLDALDLGRVHLCGHSFGGWLAACFTVDHPQRVTSLTLLDPARVFAPFTLSWLLHCVPPFLFPTKASVRRFFRWAGGAGDRHAELMELATLGMVSFRLRAPEAADIPDESLRHLAVPTQQLIADRTVVHRPHRALRTAARINPAVDSHLIADSSHFLAQDQPHRVLAALEDIITRTDPRR